MRIRVTSFRRLAHTVSQMAGGSTLQPLSALGKQMLVRRIVEENRGTLRVFGRAAMQPGFCLRLADLLAEMKRYGIRSHRLRRALQHEQEMTSALAAKVHDLHLILSQAEEKYAALGLLDGEDLLDRLADQVRDFADFAGARIWLDGFTGFTPQEYTVLARMLRVAAEVTVSLALPPGLIALDIKEENPFFTTWETARHLKNELGRIAESVNVEELTREWRFAEEGALAHIAAHYHAASTETYEEPMDGTVSLVGAANRRVEVEAAAREIIRMCRDHSYRYRDICLIVRDFPLYDELIPVVFGDHEVPFFMDRKRPVPHHPLLDLLRGAVDSVMTDWAYDPVMRCLKTDLFPLSLPEVDHLDNFALARGIRGRRWFAVETWPFERACDDGEVIGRGAAALATYLSPLVEAFASRRAGVMAHALKGLLERLDVAETMDLWRREAEAAGDLEAAGLHPQVFRSVNDLLTELIQALGDEEMDVETFARTLSTGLEGISLGLVPVGLDQVQVAAMGRSRSPAVKVALILGANEGVFPARAPLEGILSDEDREMLSHMNISLGPSSLRRVFDEEHMVYTALTRASDRIYLSYAQSTEDGSPLLPSTIIRRIRELFPSLTVQHIENEPPAEQQDLSPWIAHPYPAAGLLASRIRQRRLAELPGEWQEVYRVLAADTKYSSLVERIASGNTYQNRAEPLSATAVRRLYGTRLHGSVSRLETFNNCPFAYFVAYGLGLQEREVYKLAAPDVGSFFHDALDMFATRVAELGLDWGSLESERCRQLAAEVTEHLAPQLQGEILLSSNRNRYIMRRLQRTLERSAGYLGKHLGKGKFRPLAVEITFGGYAHDQPRLCFSLSDGGVMELTGRIDRVDAASHEGKLYVRVIDYKSGDARLTPLEVYHGLRIQLLVYLKAALAMVPALTGEAGQEVVPAGALYFHVQDPTVQTTGPLSEEDLDAETTKRFLPSGFVLAEPEAVRLMEEDLQGKSNIIPIRLNRQGDVIKDSQAWTREQYEAMGRHLEASIAQSAESIRQGVIDIAPARLDRHTACTYCRYRAVCGFDPGLPGNKYNEMKKIGLADLWQELGVDGEVDAVE